MSRYREFCESLRAGKARAEEEQLQRDDEEHGLPLAIGNIVRRMCESFRCPAERVRYVDSRSRLPTGALEGPPLLRYDPGSGRHGLDVEIGLRDGLEEEPCPVWVHLECVPLRHGGLELHFGPNHFHLPDEEEAFFKHVADAINRELRQEHVPGPRQVGGS